MSDMSIEAVEKARNELVAAIADSVNQKIIFDVSVASGSLIDFLKDSAQNIKQAAWNGEVPLVLIESVLDRLENFHILSTRYFVRVASKYKVLIERVGEFLVSRTEDFSLGSIKNISQITRINKDWKNFETIDTQACDAAAEFIKDVRTNVNNIKYKSEAVNNCKLFTVKLQMLLDNSEGTFKAYDDLLKQQRTVHIPRMLQVSQSLIEKKQPIFVD